MLTYPEDKKERKLGEMIAQDPNIYKGGVPKSHDVTLADYHIKNMQSHRWQRLFDIPEEQAEDCVN